MKNINLVFWWNIPCEGIINVFLEIEKINPGETIIITGKLSDSRKSMGWKDKGQLSENHLLLNDNEYGAKDLELLEKYRNHVHVIGGIVHPPYVKKLMEKAIELNVTFFNMSEAYSNMDFTFRRPFRNLYYKWIYPFLHKKIAKNSKGVFSLSGGSPKTLEKFTQSGWKLNKVFPFGYYTDEKTWDNSNQTNEEIQILCPGLIEKYKGVDILIDACRMLVNNGKTNFKIHITGDGSQRKSIENSVNDYGLQSFVFFYGALPYEEYLKLYKKTDILVAPGREEPWGIRINEAVQRGLVVISSDGIGASDLIHESKGGDVFKTGDAVDLAGKLEIYLNDKNRLIQAKKVNIDYRININPKEKAKELLKILEEKS